MGDALKTIAVGLPVVIATILVVTGMMFLCATYQWAFVGLIVLMGIAGTALLIVAAFAIGAGIRS